MYSYINSELPQTVFDNFKQVDPDRVSIFGHSMGGHGALTLVSASSFPPPLSFPLIHERSLLAWHRIANPIVLLPISSSRIPANTDPSPPSPQSPTRAIAPGARKPSAATSARTKRQSGRSTTRRSSSRSGPGNRWMFSSTSYVLLAALFLPSPLSETIHSADRL